MFCVDEGYIGGLLLRLGQQNLTGTYLLKPIVSHTCVFSTSSLTPPFPAQLFSSSNKIPMKDALHLRLTLK